MDSQGSDLSLTNDVEQAVADSEIPKLYANGFTCTIGLGDVAIVLKHTNRTVGLVNMSYTIAKTLSEKLQQSIEVLERSTQKEIMTTDFIRGCLEEREAETGK